MFSFTDFNLIQKQKLLKNCFDSRGEHGDQKVWVTNLQSCFKFFLRHDDNVRPGLPPGFVFELKGFT